MSASHYSYDRRHARPRVRAKPAEIRTFLTSTFAAERARELTDKMRVAGVPLGWLIPRTKHEHAPSIASMRVDREQTGRKREHQHAVIGAEREQIASRAPGEGEPLQLAVPGWVRRWPTGATAA